MSEGNEGNGPFGRRITRKQFLTGAALTGTGLVVLAGLGTQTGRSALEQAGLSSSDMIEMTLRVNGGEYPLSVEPRVSLLDALRERAGLTGTKKGCNQGACGACTVHAGGRRINSCLALAAMYDGVELTTIEGLADGDRLHPMQAAFIENDGFQCGACTSGQIMSAVALIEDCSAFGSDQDGSHRMHRVTEESWLTKSADRSIARRTSTAALATTRPPRRLDKQCFLIEVRYILGVQPGARRRLHCLASPSRDSYSGSSSCLSLWR